MGEISFRTYSSSSHHVVISIEDRKGKGSVDTQLTPLPDPNPMLCTCLTDKQSFWEPEIDVKGVRGSGLEDVGDPRHDI